MKLAELRRFAEEHPDGSVVQIPRAVLLEALSDVAAAAPAPSVAIDLTVAELAQRMNRGQSTVRTWIERGDLPGAYRNHGREWRIPVSAIEAMQRAQAKSHTARPAKRKRGVTDISEWRQHTTVGAK